MIVRHSAVACWHSTNIYTSWQARTSNAELATALSPQVVMSSHCRILHSCSVKCAHHFSAGRPDKTPTALPGPARHIDRKVGSRYPISGTKSRIDTDRGRTSALRPSCSCFLRTDRRRKGQQGRGFLLQTWFQAIPRPAIVAVPIGSDGVEAVRLTDRIALKANP